MGLDDFFQGPKLIKHKEEKKPEKTQTELKRPTEQPPGVGHLATTDFDIGEDIDKIFLLDVIYEPISNSAQCIFYHEESKSIYKWNDTSGHQPYLLTLMSEEIINQIPQVVNSKDYVGMEQEEKYFSLEEKSRVLTKVIGTNPLAIGGKSSSSSTVTSRLCSASSHSGSPAHKLR